MTGSFILDYYVLVVLASIGVFQVAAAHKGFRGMLLFQCRPASFVFGLALLVGAFTWFFLSEPRNVSDSAHGLNGNEQFAYFFAGTGTGLAVTLIVGSLRNWRMGVVRAKAPLGLDALKEISYIRAFFHTGLILWPGIRLSTDATPKRPASEGKGLLGGFVSDFRLGRRIIAWVAGGTRRAALVRRRVSSWS